MYSMALANILVQPFRMITGLSRLHDALRHRQGVEAEVAGGGWSTLK